MPSTDSTLIQGGLLCCALYYLSITQIAGEGNILTKLYEISEDNLLSSWINAKLQVVPENVICLAGNCLAGCSIAARVLLWQYVEFSLIAEYLTQSV